VTHRVKRCVIFIKGQVMDMHGDVGLMKDGAACRIVEHDETIAPPADGTEPLPLGVVDKAIDNAVLAGEIQDTLAPGPVEDFHARGPGQAIDVIDLADAADRQVRAVGRKGQSAHAADGSNALGRRRDGAHRRLERIGSQGPGA